MNKRLTNIRAYDLDKQRLKELSKILSNIQENKVTTPEIVRRAFNIPNIKDILIKDAEMKKLLSKRGGI